MEVAQADVDGQGDAVVPAAVLMLGLLAGKLMVEGGIQNSGGPQVTRGALDRILRGDIQVPITAFGVVLVVFDVVIGSVNRVN